jgi:putative DNA primase/helicase
MRGAAATARSKNLARAVSSAKTVNAVVNLAKSDNRHASIVDDWDRDPSAINTPGGTWDKDGRRDHRREDYITKITAVAPSGACPRWMAFLKDVTEGKKALQDYLQRVAGYCLTGETIEQVLFFLHGGGANGKSVFIDTLNGVWGDYATVAPMETLIKTENDRHPTELAFLRGARLVTAQETEKGRSWAESKIKALTGDKKISARFMRQDFFEFTIRFKLMISGNHKPSLSGVDQAIRRRFHLIPFVVTIPEEKRDLKLAEKLKEEWGGILQSAAFPLLLRAKRPEAAALRSCLMRDAPVELS